MADQLRLRGGPTAESEVFVGAEREVTVDTGLKALRIHDGVTPGGHLVELAAAATASRALVASDSTSVSRPSHFAGAVIASADIFASQTPTDTKVSEVLGGAPELLDTSTS